MNRKQVIAIVVAAGAVAGVLWLAGVFQSEPPIDPSQLSGLLTGEAPWGANQDQLKERLRAMRLPVLATEGAALHTHQHLDIYIHGRKIDIPAEIGIGPRDSFISQIHTHEPDAIIHVESPTIEKFTLGQFFDVWGVRLSENCIGGYCKEGEDQLKVYSNGTLFDGNPKELELVTRQQIMIVFGRDSETPESIPASYNFPPGL